MVELTGTSIQKGVIMILISMCSTSVWSQDSWRSRWYPQDWTPEHTDADGRFLHDFSYAGYQNGESALPRPSGPIFDARQDYGADATGKTDASRAIQNAMDAASQAGGGIILLRNGLYRCDEPLTIRSSHTIFRGEDETETRIFFTSVPDRGWRNHIRILGRSETAGEIRLARDADNRADAIAVDDAGDLKPGDDILIGWVISPAFVTEHHMEGTWKTFNGKWRPFFMREITAVDKARTPNQIHLDVPLRYPVKVRDQASVKRVTGMVSECGIESLSVSNAVAWDDAWSRAGVHAVEVRNAKDCWVRKVHSFASPLPEAKGYHLQGGGVYVCTSKRVTIADCSMQKAQNRGGGGAGYLFEVSRSNEILTRDCLAVAGRHNFIQNWDFGATGLVWLRCVSRDGRGYMNKIDPLGYQGLCEYHHSLAMACLVDSCTLDDGWFGGNRHNWSSGAGATVAQSVYWNTRGKGRLRSWQSGNGYIIGTKDIRVETDMNSRFAEGTAPEDLKEGIGQAETLRPQSLYDDQLRRRLEKE